MGGPYLAVHLRRRDFLRGREESFPTIKNAAFQLKKKLEELKLKKIFVATDAESHGMKIKVHDLKFTKHFQLFL